VPIRILPEQVAAAIAAGEVVERPESVVKELIENSLDAGAGRIEISIEGGGQRLIQVEDNGHGIPAQELPLAVVRFATSKLQSVDDLQSIDTLGFRGEALSSIGAVARREIVSRSTTDTAGSRLVVEAGNVQAQSAVPAPVGSAIRVRELFFNVPARRKFLKTENTERRRIQTLVTRYALAYPDVAFLLSLEGRQAFQSSGKGDRREVLAAVFGLQTAHEMITVLSPEGGQIQVRGFISPPSVNRGTRNELTFFINGRWVRDSSLSAAVIQAYHGLLMVGRYPMVVLVLEMPPSSVDVNVHPTKAEVRFREQGEVFSLVQRVLRSTLIGQAAAPNISFEGRWKPSDVPGESRAIDPAWQLTQLERDLKQPEPMDAQSPLPVTDIPLLRAVGQVGSAYLVAEGPDGLYLIDQHAAHERILFEAMMKAYAEGAIESQQLLEGITLDLNASQASLLDEQLEVMKKLGFDVASFGRNTFRVHAIPSLLLHMQPDAAVRIVIEDFEEDETPLAGEVEARVAARVCKRAAVKSGQLLSLEEQRRLIQDLEACESPRTCPHGRPTMVHLSVDALEKQFGRKG